MVTVDSPGREGKHIGIELFSDQAPGLGFVMQFIGSMPGARFMPLENPYNLYFRNPENGDLYGVIRLNLTNAPGMGELGRSMAPWAVAGLREELQTRMCPRQIAYIVVDGAYSPELVSYLSREIPRFMAHLGNNAAAVIVPCVGQTEKAHWVVHKADFPSRLEEAIKLVAA